MPSYSYLVCFQTVYDQVLQTFFRTFFLYSSFHVHLINVHSVLVSYQEWTLTNMDDTEVTVMIHMFNNAFESLTLSCNHWFTCLPSGVFRGHHMITEKGIPV